MNAEVLAKQEFFPYMDGRAVFKLAVTLLPKLALELLEKAGIQPEALDMVVPHQANLRIIESVAKRLNLSPEQVMINIQKYGNTTAASIIIALTEAWEENKVKEGDTVVLVAFGSGFTWGSVILKW